MLTAVATAALLLHGCGGGSDGAQGPAGPAGPAGTPAPTTPTTSASTAPVNATQLSAAQFAATQFKASITGVTIASAPVVTFKVTDANGNAVSGLGMATKSSTATVPRYQNISFTLAKLVPGAPGLAPGTAGPSKWVSYIVTTVPTTSSPTATATRPTSDSNGTLVDNGDGTYKYTFYRDITKVKDQVAAMTLTGANVATDLGDLTYDPNAIHRLGMQISGSAPGTGTNTPTEVQVTAAVPMARPVNAWYDFIPATGKAVAPTDAGERVVVDVASCNECHGKLGGIPGTESAGFHGGTRYDPQYCVTCHTDQRKYGQARAVSTNYAFPALTRTVDASGNVKYSPYTYVADGVTVGDFPALIHKLHSGELLVKTNYNFANIPLNETLFPQDIRNCSKCHDGTAPKVAPQGSNFKTVPSRLACGSCHDGIDFSTGQGVQLAASNDAKVNGGTPAANGHVGGVQADDTKCALCHDATSIETVYHVPTTRPNPANVLAGGTNPYTNAAFIASNVKNLPAGAVAVTYDIKSVSRDSSQHPKMVFRMLQNGTAVPFNASSAKPEIWDGFVGSPTIYFVYAVPQDGVNTPNDFNASVNSYLKKLWNGTSSGAGTGTITGPDSSGYYTVVLTGAVIPDNAVMLTGGLGYDYSLPGSQPLTQINLSGKFAFNATNKTGGLIVIAKDAQVVASAGCSGNTTCTSSGGYVGRRPIVEDARCNACHQELGPFTLDAFHAGQRNDGTTCAWCHNPNKTSSGWAADSTSFIHGIHGASKRTTAFTWHATTPDGFSDVGYPGILSNCETCHLPGTYDYSASTSAIQVSNRLPRTVAAGTITAAISDSPYIVVGTGYGAPASVTAATGVLNPAAATTLINSPTVNVCVACHDSSADLSHFQANGGLFYAARTSWPTTGNPEQCLICHGNGKVADIGAVHAK